ncbi:MAG TPA: SDR family oxidoreductase [Rubrobacteraceae bacterium]|nr:SDR family oxidoreductase [Rubrobacteraceae bacterium]
MSEIGGGLAGCSLAGRVAVVTGASRRTGIGAAICRELAGRGADVLFTHWRPYDRDAGAGEDLDGPQDLLEELSILGTRAEALEVDLSRPKAAGTVLEATVERLGPPSILVNNAAYSTRDGFERLDAATLDAHYAVNVRATALLSVLFAKGYENRSGGRIINLTSGQDDGPMPGELAYVASKGAISAFVRTLAAEVGGRGITVNAVNPGPTDTGWMTEELKEELLPRFPLGRLGSPEDAARVVAWLASEEAGWVTGQIITSDGGFF